MIGTAVILAAGEGSKMWPLGATWPKAALPVANRPLIRWQMDALKALGVKDTLVVTGRLGGQVRAALEGEAGVRFAEQPRPAGTADALSRVAHLIQDEAFAVLYGDALLTEAGLRRLFETHERTGEAAALVKVLGGEPPQDWICANAEDGRIKSILGHPREASHRLCGAFVFPNAFLGELQYNPGLMTSVEVGQMPPMEAELAESLSSWIRRGNGCRAAEAFQPFFDLDKPWQYLEANERWLEWMFSNLAENRIAESASISRQAEIDGYVIAGEGAFIGPGVKIKGNVSIGKNTRIYDGPIVGGNTAIGADCEVREYCKIEPGSAIGNGCVAGHAAEFGGVMMDGAYAYHYGEFWGVLGRSSDLGAATVCGTLRFDDQTTLHRVKGRRESARSHHANASFLGDYVRTGVNAILMPGVRVGPYCVIGAGVILQEDLPDGTSVFVEQTLRRAKWGPERYGW